MVVGFSSDKIVLSNKPPRTVQRRRWVGSKTHPPSCLPVVGQYSLSIGFCPTGFRRCFRGLPEAPGEVPQEAHPPRSPPADDEVSAARQHLQYQPGDAWLRYVDREYPSGIDFEAQAEWEDPKGGRIYWLPNPNWNP